MRVSKQSSVCLFVQLNRRRRFLNIPPHLSILAAWDDARFQSGLPAALIEKIEMITSEIAYRYMNGKNRTLVFLI